MKLWQSWFIAVLVVRVIIAVMVVIAVLVVIEAMVLVVMVFIEFMVFRVVVEDIEVMLAIARAIAEVTGLKELLKTDPPMMSFTNLPEKRKGWSCDM